MVNGRSVSIEAINGGFIVFGYPGQADYDRARPGIGVKHFEKRFYASLEPAIRDCEAWLID